MANEEDVFDSEYPLFRSYRACFNLFNDFVFICIYSLSTVHIITVIIYYLLFSTYSKVSQTNKNLKKQSHCSTLEST